MSVVLSMSEVGGVGEPSVVAVTGLRQARERAGLQVAVLAEQLKVPVQRLEALEAGRYEDLPDLTFARALASSVCRVLKIDPTPVLAALPSSEAVRLGEHLGSLNAPMPSKPRTPFGSSSGSGGSPRSIAPWLAVGVLLVAGAMWWWLPQVAPTEAVPVDAESPAMGSVATADASIGNVTATVIASTEVVDPVVTSGTAEAVSVSSAVPSLPREATPASVAAVEPSAAVHVLHIQALQPSWVQVIGSSGKVWLQRGLQAGEVVQFQEDAPFSVVVGNAGGTAIQWRGLPFDMLPQTRNNVARFELK